MARPGDDFDRDILDIIPERFDADADSRQARAGHRLRTGVTLAFAVVAVGGIVAAGLHFVGGKRSGGSGIPVIKADDRPIKVRPDDRGGMQVPNQDKLVYERMDGEGTGQQPVERLLPPPEAPKAPPKGAAAVPPPAPVAELPAAKAPEMITPPKTAAKAEPPAPKAAPAPAPQVAAMPPQPQPQPVAPTPVAPVAAPKPAAPPPPVAVAPKAPASGDWVVQLGAVRAADQAEKEWARIQRTNHDLLGALKSDIVRVELEGKGTFWRVRAGPLSEQAARQLCQELTSRSQGCILARK
ncbi:MAG: SPOR domain-containing protein [Actinomycetota bacterium]